MAEEGLDIKTLTTTMATPSRYYMCQQESIKKERSQALVIDIIDTHSFSKTLTKRKRFIESKI